MSTDQSRINTNGVGHRAVFGLQVTTSIRNHRIGGYIAALPH